MELSLSPMVSFVALITVDTITAIVSSHPLLVTDCLDILYIFTLL